jgi:phage gp29-like protein
MRKLLATTGFVAAFVSSSALAGPYTGQDIVDGMSILGSIAGALGDIAQQGQRQQFQEMADWADRCAQRDLQAVVNGVKTDADVQNLELLVKNGDIARRVMRKCVGKQLVDAGVGIKDVQDRIVIPSLNAWIAKRNALVEKQNEAQRAQTDSERAQVAATNNIELNCPAPVVLVGDRSLGKVR